MANTNKENNTSSEKLTDQGTERNYKRLCVQDSDSVPSQTNADVEMPLSPLQLSQVEAYIGSPGSLNNSFSENPGHSNDNCNGTPTCLSRSFNDSSFGLNNNTDEKSLNLSNSFSGTSTGPSFSYDRSETILSNSFNGNLGSCRRGEHSKERKGNCRTKDKVEDCKPLLDENSSNSFDLESSQITSDEGDCSVKTYKEGTGERQDASEPELPTEVNKENDLHVTELETTDLREEENLKTKTACRPESGNTVDSLCPGEGGQKEGGDGIPRTARSPRPSFRGRLHGYLEPIMPGYTGVSIIIIMEYFTYFNFRTLY